VSDILERKCELKSEIHWMAPTPPERSVASVVLMNTPVRAERQQQYECFGLNGAMASYANEKERENKAGGRRLERAREERRFLFLNVESGSRSPVRVEHKEPGRPSTREAPGPRRGTDGAGRSRRRRGGSAWGRDARAGVAISFV
jgi:hypothetical protein